MKVKAIMNTLEHFAPLPLQEDYDNAGLQTGLQEAEVSRVLLCLDVTESVLTEAMEKGCNLIVAHHPLLFHPLHCVSDRTQAERCTRIAIKHDIAIYAAHTNLDNARNGVNFEIARRIGLQDVDFLQPKNGTEGSGLTGWLPKAEEPKEFLLRIKDLFHVDCLEHNALLNRPIRNVALCGGAGDFLLNDAVKAGADAFLTGEMHYHTFFGWEDVIQIGVLGHYQSELSTIHLLHDILHEALPELPLVLTETNTNPISYLF